MDWKLLLLIFILVEISEGFVLTGAAAEAATRSARKSIREWGAQRSQARADREQARENSRIGRRLNRWARTRRNVVSAGRDGFVEGARRGVAHAGERRATYVRWGRTGAAYVRARLTDDPSARTPRTDATVDPPAGDVREGRTGDVRTDPVRGGDKEKAATEKTPGNEPAPGDQKDTPQSDTTQDDPARVRPETTTPDAPATGDGTGGATPPATTDAGPKGPAQGGNMAEISDADNAKAVLANAAAAAAYVANVVDAIERTAFSLPGIGTDFKSAAQRYYDVLSAELQPIIDAAATALHAAATKYQEV